MSDVILQKLLDNVPDSYQKTVGYPTWDILQAVALTLDNIAGEIETAKAKQNVDNLKGEELSRFVRQRKGIVRKEATKAVGMLEVTGSGTIHPGDLFETVAGVQFAAVEGMEVDGVAIVRIGAVLAGSRGNVGAGAITEMPVTLPGIVNVVNKAATYDGYEAETDGSLRERYYTALQAPATSGNQYHYKIWATTIAGVGGAVVYPLWSGDNTVQVVIVNADMEPPSGELVDKVQDYIDPGVSGIGAGVAPIGAYCTVAAAIGLDVQISLDVKLLKGYTLAEVTANIRERVKAYLKAIALKQNYISYAKIASAVMEAEGVEDYTNLLVNGGISNIEMPEKQVAVLAEVSADEV